MIKSTKKFSDLPRIAASLPEIGAPATAIPKIHLPRIATDPDMVRQIAEIQKQWKEIKTLAPAWLAELSETTRRVAETWAKVRAQFNEAWVPMKTIFAEIARTAAECKRIEDAGWLPHYTTPFGDLAECDGDSGEFHLIIERHYRDQWPTVKMAFLEHLAAYDIEEESKATFREVLDAHSHGLYRTSARTLFPEIERVARKEIHEGSMKPITSQKELKALAGHLGLRDTQPGGFYALSIFRKFFKHLYARTQTEEHLAIVAMDSVPNRHASLHGYLSYGTARCSVNALIMTDFIFQIVCALKREVAENATKDTVPAVS